ncbi:MAG: nucleoside monophosphate kinase [Candidatus Paceibacterota bacterium]
MKKQIITIAGKPGSGKSTTAKRLSGELNYAHFSSGDFFRQVGLDKRSEPYHPFDSRRKR